MRTLSPLGPVVLVLTATLAGCMKPIRLDVNVVPPPDPATVNVRLMKGSGKPPTPDTCQTPCSIEIAPGTTNEAVVQAVGYYPAIIEFTYENVLASKAGKTNATLVVPMVKRPEVGSIGAHDTMPPVVE